MTKKIMHFKFLSKIILLIGLCLLLIGSLVTTIEASHLTYMTYDTYAKKAKVTQTLASDKKVLDVPIADGWKTIGIALPSSQYDYKINNDLKNELRITYETSLNEDNEPMRVLGLDTQTTYDDTQEDQISEPVVTITQQRYYSHRQDDFLQLWFEQIKEGVFLTTGPENESVFRATVELNQDYYDKLDLTSGNYDRILLK